MSDVGKATLPEEVFQDLMAGAESERKRRSLRILHDVLSAHNKAGEVDFTVATIGKISKRTGGPASQTMRNKPYGKDYKRLVEAWATHSGINPRPVTLETGGSKLYDLVEKISDPAMRAMVGSLIAERNSLERQNRTLKQHTEVVVDRRPALAEMEILAPMEGIINQMEIEALEDAVSDSLFEKMGMTTDETGRVKIGGVRLYKAGYVTAIKKLLEQV